MKKVISILLAIIMITNSSLVLAKDVDELHSSMKAIKENSIKITSEEIKEEYEKARREVDKIYNFVKERERAYKNIYALSEPDFITMDEVSKLTIEDYKEISDYIKGNQDFNNDKVIQMMREKAKVSPLDSNAGLNAHEAALIASFPVHGALYVTNSKNARDTALDIYTDNSCWFSGNGDAYRHVLWNVILTKDFSIAGPLDEWSLDAKHKTRTFTAAHEYNIPDDIHREMDERNNEIGLLCYDSWKGYSKSKIKTYCENFIDIGGAYRVDVGGLVPTSNSEKR